MRPVAVGPYAKAAKAYWEEGWTPLPLPRREKTPPPKGWTGGSKANSGELPSAAQVETWMAENGDGNICLRAPKSVIGIDVDMYDGKAGAATLAAAEEAWGELPDTWVSTSRSDGSGIRWFRIEEGLAWPGQLPQGGGVELIRWDHRYGVVAPSTNPINNDEEYVWINPAGERTTDAEGWEFPSIAELPWLPDAWVAGLTAGKRWTPRAEAEMDPIEIRDWLTERGDHAACAVMQRTLQKWLQEIRKAGADGGAHDAARNGVWAVIGDSAAGHKGIRKALERLMAAFKESMRSRDPGRDWRGEWRRFVNDGVRKVAAEGDPEDEDVCELDETTRPARERRSSGGSGAMDFARNDTGNGRRFALRYRDSVRYVPEFDGWFVWGDKAWSLDRTGEITRMAIETAESIKQEAQYLDDEKEKEALLKFASASGNEGKLKAMLNVARDFKGMTVPASQFDASPNKLSCANGTLILPNEGEGRVRLKPSVLEDYNTHITPVAFLGLGASAPHSPEWEKYLARFHPDLEVRAWLQKLAGYSMLGRNPRRIMVACYGETSTGKTTFVNAMEAALGPYAGSTAMTIFRDNQDERSRPDLVRVLPKRFVYAEETSSAWHLHPDQIKRLTGGAKVTARVPFAKAYMDLVPAFTPWLLTNSAPTIEGADTALRRRLLVVPFDQQISTAEEDAGFEVRLLDPAGPGPSAILSWLVEGYQAYLAAPESLQQIPEGAVKATMEFWAEVSDLDLCLSDICEFGEPSDYFVKPSHLYAAYLAWVEERGIKERDRISLIMLGRQLKAKGFKLTSSRKVAGKEGKPVPVRAGLRLKRDWMKVVSEA